MDGWVFIWVLFALIITGSGFVQSAMGFGFGIVALAFLPYFMDVRMANIVISLSVLAPLAAGTWTYRSMLDWRMLLYCMAGATAGLPIGLAVFVYVDASWLVRGTGAAILLMAVHGLVMGKGQVISTASGRWSAIAGAASGFLAGAVGIGGPPIVAYAVRQPWSPSQFKAFVISFLLTLALLKNVSLAVAGLINSRILLLAAIAVPFGYLGSQLGISASRKINSDHFRRMTLVLLAFASFGMIVCGSPSHQLSSAQSSSLQLTQQMNIRHPSAK